MHYIIMQQSDSSLFPRGDVRYFLSNFHFRSRKNSFAYSKMQQRFLHPPALKMFLHFRRIVTAGQRSTLPVYVTQLFPLGRVNLFTLVTPRKKRRGLHENRPMAFNHVASRNYPVVDELPWRFSFRIIRDEGACRAFRNVIARTKLASIRRLLIL